MRRGKAALLCVSLVFVRTCEARRQTAAREGPTIHRERLLGVGAIAVIALACAGACACAAGARPAASPPPAGWWIVESAHAPDDEAWPLVHDLGVPSAAWRFAPAELQGVRPGFVVDRVATVLVAESSDSWRLRAAADGARARSCELHRQGAALTLRCDDSGTLVVFRSAQPDEASSAEAAIAKHGSPAAICARAAACAEQGLRAFPYLDEYAPRDARAQDLRVCERALVIFARQYRLTGRVAPPGCGL